VPQPEDNEDEEGEANIEVVEILSFE